MGLLRFLLALSVIITHSTTIFGIKLVGGEVAVQTFFVISGFYMGLILKEKYTGKNSSYSLFITNRLLRLYPIYWVILIISVSLSVVAYIKFGPHASEKISDLTTSIKNGAMSLPMLIWYCFTSIFLFFQDTLIYLGISSGHHAYFVKDFHVPPGPLSRFLFVPQAWTLGLELSFYLLAPFLTKRSNFVLLIILIISILIRITLYHFGYQNDPWTYRFFPSELAFFLIGIFSYRFYAVIKTSEKVIIKKIQPYCLPCSVLLTIIYQWTDTSICRYFYPVLIACLIPFMFNYLKNNKYDIWIGELSYPMYISHITVQCEIYT
jgi:peptidoglycan/LPS O-acetylase OafA/YrhL